MSGRFFSEMIYFVEARMGINPGSLYILAL